MKIALANDIVYAYAAGDPSAVGGAERYQWLLARELAARGWTVSVGVRAGVEPGEERLIEGVRFTGIGNGGIVGAWHRFLSRSRPEWFYWMGADHLAGVAIEIAKRLGSRTIFSAAFDRDVSPRRALHQRPAMWPLYAWGLARSDRIFVQHGGQLAGLPLLWRRKASVLPGIVDQARVKPHAQRPGYVAWVAVLRQVKRPDLLIEIARRLPDFRFVACGGTTRFMSPPGYAERTVAALRAQPNIDYRGPLAPDEALRIIGDAALLLSTSDEEGFPSVFLEAWAAGTPVVSLKVDPDRVIGRRGLGTVAGSVEQAVSDIRALIGFAARREAIAERGLRYVRERHSGAAVVRAFEEGLAGANGRSAMGEEAVR